MDMYDPMVKNFTSGSTSRGKGIVLRRHGEQTPIYLTNVHVSLLSQLVVLIPDPGSILV
jgi:acyl-coenzyme A synthetase/AMP-(fatty) acid ligase